MHTQIVRETIICIMAQLIREISVIILYREFFFYYIHK